MTSLPGDLPSGPSLGSGVPKAVRELPVNCRRQAGHPAFIFARMTRPQRNLNSRRNSFQVPTNLDTFLKSSRVFYQLNLAENCPHFSLPSMTCPQFFIKLFPLPFQLFAIRQERREMRWENEEKRNRSRSFLFPIPFSAKSIAKAHCDFIASNIFWGEGMSRAAFVEADGWYFTTW